MVNTLDRAGYGVLLPEVEKEVDILTAHFDMKKDSAKASSQGDTFEGAESSSETFVSNNNISQIDENVSPSGKNIFRAFVGLQYNCCYVMALTKRGKRGGLAY